MNDQPLVSVVIIFLNAGKFIGEAIESVFAQTYNNWELLLVDDGSSDSSTQIALSYAERHPGKVRYLEHAEHQNRGMGASRNLGVHHAKGEYIALLDADDVWLPHKLEQQVAILDSHPEAAMVYGKSQYWHGWTGDPEDVQRDTIPELGVQANTLFEPPDLLTLLYPLGEVPPPCPSDLLLRRGMIERVGGFEESFKDIYHMYEDQAFLAKVWLSEPVFAADVWWDRYRQHPEQCVTVVQEAGQYYAVRSFFFNWLAEYLYKQGVSDPGTWKLIQEKQFRVSNNQLRKLRNTLAQERKKNGRLRKQNRQLTLEVQSLDQQLQSIQNSNVWMWLLRAKRLRDQLLGKGSRLPEK
jgi:glycosyltransferase involved in cell wall biosynthesis